MRALTGTLVGRRAEDRATDGLTRLVEALRTWRRRIRARRALGQVDHRTLRDAGVDPLVAQYEATRPFWIAERRLRDR